MLEIVRELKRRDCYVVTGGPWISVQEDYFGELADALFVGEAEETWPRFLADWEAGKPARRYEQAEETAMTRVPTPRLDLLKMKRYGFASVQFSREFCDIVVVYGRRPRIRRRSRSSPSSLVSSPSYSAGLEFELTGVAQSVEVA